VVSTVVVISLSVTRNVEIITWSVRGQVAICGCGLKTVM